MCHSWLLKVVVWNSILQGAMKDCLYLLRKGGEDSTCETLILLPSCHTDLIATSPWLCMCFGSSWLYFPKTSLLFSSLASPYSCSVNFKKFEHCCFDGWWNAPPHKADLSFVHVSKMYGRSKTSQQNGGILSVIDYNSFIIIQQRAV